MAFFMLFKFNNNVLEAKKEKKVKYAQGFKKYQKHREKERICV